MRFSDGHSVKKHTESLDDGIINKNILKLFLCEALKKTNNVVHKKRSITP